MKVNEVVIVTPPKEVFIKESDVSWIWDEKGVTDGAKVELPKNEGMIYFPSERGIPYRGFPFALATSDVAIFKRFLLLRMNSLKNPLSWGNVFSLKREIHEMAYTSIDRYFLKPEYYCRSVREVYRLISKYFGDFLAHCVATILQWDVAYRYRVQASAGFINQGNLKKNPLHEIWKVLGYAYRMDGNHKVKKTWRAIQLAYALSCIVMPFKLRKIFRELDVQKLLMDGNDRFYAFPDLRNK